MHSHVEWGLALKLKAVGRGCEENLLEELSLDLFFFGEMSSWFTGLPLGKI